MPSFRDLRGHPVDDLVDSRVTPTLPDPGQVMVEREAVRHAVEKITAHRPRKETPDPEEPLPFDGEPTDFDTAMGALNAALAVAHDRLQALQEGLGAALVAYDVVRGAAARDLGKVRKLQELIKTLDG